MPVLRNTLIGAAMTLAIASGSAAYAANPMVGGAAMYPTKNIVENAVNSKDHTTLVAAVKAAGLVDTLTGTGPFTVFAPTNAAFAKLPAGTVDTLLKPENKAMLASVLTYHVVPGTITAADIAANIKAHMGKATYTTVQGGTLTKILTYHVVPGKLEASDLTDGKKLKTVEGEQLTVKHDGKKVMIMDAKGGSSMVTISNVNQSNGVIHVVDTVLMPAS